MKFDLIGGTSEYRYQNINGEKTVNWYVNIAEETETGSTKKSLFPTPGLDSFAETSLMWGRGSIVCNLASGSRAFVVIYTTLYEVYSHGTLTSRGSLTNLATGSTKVWMRINSENQLFIANYNGAYIFDLDTNVLTEVTDVDYPGNLTSLDYSAGYFLMTSGGTIYYSNILDGFSWTGTDFFNAEEDADETKVLINYREDLFLFGAKTIQIYINDGETPFTKLPRTMSHIGLVSNEAAIKCDAGILFPGRSEYGQVAVYAIGQQYAPQKISTTAITQQLNTITDYEGMDAFIQYSKDGHVLYHLSVPSLNTTFVYDINTQIWTEKQSKLPWESSDGEYLYSCYRGRYPFNLNGMNLFLDRYSGNVLKENYSTLTEDGELIRRIRRSPKFDSERKHITIDALEIYSNSGSSTITDAQIMLRLSKDAGYTFGNSIGIPLYEQGNYDYRVRTNTLGTSRSWNVELTLTDAVDVVIQDAIISGSVSAW